MRKGTVSLPGTGSLPCLFKKAAYAATNLWALRNTTISMIPSSEVFRPPRACSHILSHCPVARRCIIVDRLNTAWKRLVVAFDSSRALETSAAGAIITESGENLHRHRELRYLQAFWRYFCLLAEVIGLMVQLKRDGDQSRSRSRENSWVDGNSWRRGIELGLWPSKSNTLTLMPMTFGLKFGRSGGSFPGAGATQPIE